MPTARRLLAADAEAFQRLRLESFEREPRCFRFAPEDQIGVSRADNEALLDRDYTVGTFVGEGLIGIGGFRRFVGAKLAHKGLIWGMYVRETRRGSGVANAIMSALIEQARAEVEVITLTVVSDNERAVRFYERWGFTKYGVEPISIKLADGTYLDETLMGLKLR